MLCILYNKYKMDMSNQELTERHFSVISKSLMEQKLLSDEGTGLRPTPPQGKTWEFDF